MPPKDTLGNRVRVVRERLGVTQVDLAREVGISRQALISVEKGRMNPSVVVSLKIARILREPVDYLFFIDGRAGGAPEPVEKRAPSAVAAAPKPEPEPQPEPAPVHVVPPPETVDEEPAPEPEPEPAFDSGPESEPEFEPAFDSGPESEPEPEPDPEPEPAAASAPPLVRHAVPVSAEPEAATTGEVPGNHDEPDDAQLSLFE